MFQINWKLKALLYKVFEIFKLKKSFYLLQKHVTKRSLIKFKKINEHWKTHAKSIESNNLNKILEIGAGKSLDQNIYFSYYFNFSKKQTVIDITPMIDLQLLNQASKKIAEIMKLPFKGEVKNLKDLEIKYNIKYESPLNINELKENNFDVCISTTTLEHFSIKDLNDFLKTMPKKLGKKGMISSIIDYSDHYAHTDRNISFLNFLKYNDDQWQKYNNKFLFQNRLRHQDYRNMFKSQNYKIIKEMKGNLIEEIEGISKKFDNSNQETFISWGYYLITPE